MRLTNYTRKQIVSRMLKTQFAAEHLALIEERAELADRVYRTAFDRNARRRMERLPEGWLTTASTIPCICGGEFYFLRFDGRWNDSRIYRIEGVEPQTRRVPAEIARRPYEIEKIELGKTFVFGKRHPITIALTAHAKKVRELGEKVDKARQSANMIINGCRSTNSLCTKWPEIAPFLPDGIGTEQQAKDVKIEELNEALGLA